MGIQVTRDLVHSRTDQPILIVGLGNTGVQYEQTRHNIGFLAVDALIEKLGLPNPSEKSSLNAHVSEGHFAARKIITAKPTTLMNNSGQAVQRLLNFYQLGLHQLLVVHDDIDLPFGTIKTKVGGSSGGHNGINSIDMLNGEEYARIRIGVADEHRDKQEAGDYVLRRIPKAQWDQLTAVFAETNRLSQDFAQDKFSVQSVTVELNSNPG